MKNLHYLSLFLLLATFSACTEDADRNEYVELSDLEKATLYLNHVNSPVLFGKALVDSEGNWQNGWILTKAGELRELDYSPYQQPSKAYEMDEVQLDNLFKSGTVLTSVEDKVALATNHNSAELKENSLIATEGVAFFSIHIEEGSRNCENGSCGDSYNHGPAKFLVSIISMNDEIANTSSSVANAEWLQSIDNLLN